ncbi:MAG TPA: tRNA uridine-5-carboxymethylaminomethyl(34) synthesis enzyme MnmG [Candidatus Brocadiia bacterium]|nr:tRNA uridine-5-carboxymethylaminomethyl(34) synthesis enzyme MnmG [Candidatus Brocadiia bacterium]
MRGVRSEGRGPGMELDFDIVVVGAGHAGCEAALAAARMGCRTALLTINLDAIAQMSCNPAIGGLAKGQIVREIDALGGEMGKATDRSAIQFRMLNTSKGPAMYAPRAQCDKKLYQRVMKQALEAQPGLAVRQDIADDLIVEAGRVAGARCASGLVYRAKAVILTTGTFLRGVIHVGDARTTGGRMGELSADKLSGGLETLGLEVGRLKTGTPPRINRRSISLERMKIQPGDPEPKPFSYANERVNYTQLPCYMTATNRHTHEIILSNLDRAPLYTGQIKSVGPRYCPSVETKVLRFGEREWHSVYLEPEGPDTLEMYCNGVSTSLPQDVQEEMLHSIAGLENAEIMRYGYAIEYDYLPPTQLLPSLECKKVRGLFLAGQINGTSGYEEAAGQGLMAGINAVLSLRGETPQTLGRDEAYIGVMIDDLVTRGVAEPYRMFTSRAEHRLLLRQDNADRRLTPLARKLGLIADSRWAAFQKKLDEIEVARRIIREKRYGANSLEEMLRRPEMNFRKLLPLCESLISLPLSREAIEQVEIEVKYEGYIRRQESQVEKFRKMENVRIPDDVDYAGAKGMRAEAREALGRVRPASMGQASRIPGITPADIALLDVYLQGLKANSRERD